MHNKTLKDWRAKRAGGMITVFGIDATTGEPTKIVGVDTITPRPRTKRFLGSSVAASVVATMKDGTEHSLLL